MPADITDLFREHGLTPVKKTAKEWASPCPCCGGKDRCNIWPEQQDGRGYFWCRQCDAKGDGIQFLRDYAGMSYADACKRVGVTPVANLKAPSLPPAKRGEKFEAVFGELGQLEGVNRPVWQGRARAFVAWATEHLVNTPVQMAWLADRGIDATAVRRYKLGYNPGEKGNNSIIRPREVWGLPPEIKEDGKPKRLWLPRGIVIPQILPGPGGTGVVHRVRIRRLDADREQFRPKCKYFVVPGSAMDVLWLPCTTSLYEGGGIVVVTESELDAILLHYLAGNLVHCVASMTSNIRNLSRDVFERLQEALCILVALDMDKAGADGWPRWERTFPRAKRWPVPTGKDPGEAFAAGENLRLWLQAGIPAGLRMVTPSGQPLDMPSQVEGREEERPVPPPDVRQLDAMWREIPITFTRFLDEGGNCVGTRWDYDCVWAAEHRDKVDAFLQLADRSRDVWEWLSRNPENLITAKNFLNYSLELPDEW
ncbi:CHC2 zinc finger domain-containing protein [uncultured Desulfovibrio sp.]|uniref:CHC2 zinc finger domain-containing protein n=1 Tax=uncultured Desulfovibrio sp. TaxID=167968 RepID=UPI002590391C|nr:CHC2 zinc finger domain-containing protein [uncultured Desulfovibrio sp.]